MKIKEIGLAMGLLLGFATVSQAATVFIDDFNRTGPLHGSITSTGGLTWVSSTNNSTVTTNGGQTGGWNAKVGFTPVTGELYLLTLTTTETIGNALEFGFGIHSGGFGQWDGLIQNVSNMQTARINADPTWNTYGSTVGGTRTHTQYTLDAGTGPGFVNTLTLLLDTTSGLSTSQLTYAINGVDKGTWVADVTGYNSVLFGRGHYGGDGSPQLNDPTFSGTVSSFQLEIIPEPSIALLGGFGMLCLLGRRRRA